MDSSLISRLVKIIGKNNDRIILPDPETGRTVVIMDLDAYEGLLGGAGKRESGRAGEGSSAAEDKPVFRAALTPVVQEIGRVAHRRAAADLESVMAPITEDEVGLPAPMPKKPRNFAKNRRPQAAELDNPFAGLKDLTQAELLDKINRDIGEWKNAQEVKRAEVLQSAAGQRPTLTVTESLEDEERFYLEPIE